MSNGKTTKTLSGAALVAALIVLAAWLGLLVWLVAHPGASSEQWARLVAVLGSVEAVAFAAAGALFGTTVQARRVTDARDAADKAEQRATAAESVAAKGKALANATLKRARTRAAAAAGARGVARGIGADEESDTDETLVALAEDVMRG